MAYIRIGNCINCGLCCRYGGCINPCEFLTEINGQSICSIYDDRPISCIEYPPDWMHCYEGCGYSFIDTDNNKIMPKIPIRIVDGKEIKIGNIQERIFNRHTEAERIEFESKMSDPFSKRSILFAKDWISKINVILLEINDLDIAISKSFDLIDHTGMLQIGYGIAVKYISNFSDYGKEVFMWYYYLKNKTEDDIK